MADHIRAHIQGTAIKLTKSLKKILCLFRAKATKKQKDSERKYHNTRDYNTSLGHL